MLLVLARVALRRAPASAVERGAARDRRSRESWCAAPGGSQQVVLESDQPEMEIRSINKRYTEEQNIGFLREADAGLPVKKLCRQHGFSEPSYYAWKAKFGGTRDGMTRSA